MTENHIIGESERLAELTKVVSKAAHELKCTTDDVMGVCALLVVRQVWDNQPDATREHRAGIYDELTAAFRQRLKTWDIVKAMTNGKDPAEIEKLATNLLKQYGTNPAGN